MARDIARHVLGKVDAASLRQAAAESKLVAPNGQHTIACECEYFIALKSRIDGDRAAFEDALERSLATRATDCGAYWCAKAELERSRR